MIKEILVSKRNLGEIDKQKGYICFGNSNYAYIRNLCNFQSIFLDSVPESGKKEETNFLNIHKLILYTPYDDDIFWINANKSNFIYITFFRLDNNMSKLLNDEFENLMIEIYIGDKKGKFALYKSLDGYDLVVASYDNIHTGLMKNLDFVKNKGISVLEVNTLVMTAQEILENGKDQDSELRRVSIRCRLKNQVGFSKMEDTLKLLNNTHFAVRNGNYDIEYFFENLIIKDLFTFCKEILDKEKDDLYKAIEEYEIRLYTESDLTENLFQCNQGTGYFKRRFKDLNDRMDILEKFNIDIRDLANIISFLESSINDRYISDAVMITYNPVIFYLKKLLGNNLGYFESYRSYTRLTDALIDIMQIFNNSRLYAMRGMSFQGERIAIPIKILTFYSSFIWMAKEILLDLEKNDKDKYKYSFLLSPTKKDGLNLNILSDDNNYNERLLLASIPLAAFFSPEEMMFQLTHEVAHYVCHKTRDREQRRNYIWNSFLDHVTNSISDNEVKNNDLSSLIATKLNKIKDEIKGEEGYADRLFSKELEAEFNQIITEFLCKLPSYIEEFELNELIKYSKNTDDETFIMLRNNLKERVSIINENCKKINSNLLNIFIDNTITLMNECFSDLIAIKLLRKSILEYFNYIMEINKKQMNDGMVSQFVVVRIAIIAYVLDYKFIEENEYNGIAKDSWEAIKDLHNCIVKVSKGADRLVNVNFNKLFVYPTSLNYICEYLKICDKEIDILIAGMSKPEILSEFRELGNGFDTDEKAMKNFFACIEKFKNNVVDKISENQ